MTLTALRVAGAVGLVAALVGMSVAIDAMGDAAPARAHLAPSALISPRAERTLAPPVFAPSPAATAGTPASQTYPFRPTLLTLPSGKTAAVEPASVGTDGSLEVPADPSQVGWWDGGALVGEPYGSVVLAGHLDSARYGIGVMVELRSLRIGDQVVVANGPQAQRFRVIEARTVPKARLGRTAEAFRQDVPHRLVLITCTGTYDRAAHAYPDNLVVVAVPIP